MTANWSAGRECPAGVIRHDIQRQGGRKPRCHIPHRCPVEPTLTDPVVVDGSQIGSGHVPHARQGALEVDVRREPLESCLGLRGRSLRRRFPVLAGRIRAVCEVHRVPELAVDPFGRVVVDADQAAAVRANTAVDGLEVRASRLQATWREQVHAGGIAAHVVDREHAVVPERLLTDAGVRAFVHVRWHAGGRDNTDLPEGGERLRRP